jgi:hypothetical protein
MIGGTACHLAMDEAGLDFRATKDLDIVLTIEALNPTFFQAFWAFIKEGKYQNRHKSSGKKLFYRFHSPQNETFPEMLELFSRKPDVIQPIEGIQLTPIPIDEEISSLSAILLNDDYYDFIHKGKVEIEGIVVLKDSHIIPLKARAWLDLKNRRDLGERIDEHNIRKHKNDVIRLFQLLSINAKILLPEQIKRDMKQFLSYLENDPINPKQLGLKNITLREIIEGMKHIYSA